jgi:hypothetical protein
MNPIFRKFLAFLSVAFTSAKTFINTWIVPAIHIVTTVKDAIDSNEFKTIADMLGLHPKNISEINRLSQLLADAIRDLGIAADCIQPDSKPSDIIKCFIAKMKSLPESVQDGMYLKLASAITKATSGTDMTGHQLDTIVQATFSKVKITSPVVPTAEVAATPAPAPVIPTPAPVPVIPIPAPAPVIPPAVPPVADHGIVTVPVPDHGIVTVPVPSVAPNNSVAADNSVPAGTTTTGEQA